MIQIDAALFMGAHANVHSAFLKSDERFGRGRVNPENRAAHAKCRRRGRD
jgi:hypothetical protein